MARQAVRVFVIDGIRSVRDDLCQLIDESRRFTLVGRAGNLEEAERKLEDSGTQVVLLDIDLHELEDIGVLHRFCAAYPEIKVVGTGGKWNDMMLKPAFNAGMSGYLSKPFEEWELARSIQELMNEKPANKSVEASANEPSCVVMFLSPKRGVGQTTLAVNTAVELADAEKGGVCLWDADLRFGDAALLLNVVPRSSIIDLAREMEGLSIRGAINYFAVHSDNLWVLASPTQPEQAELMSAQKMRDVLAFLKKSFRYVVIDAAAGFDADALALVTEADQVVLVSEVEGIAPELHLTTARNIITGMGVTSDRQIVALNRIRTQDLADVNRFHIEGRNPVLFLFPNDYPSVTASLNSGEPVVRSKPDSQMGRTIGQFADLLRQR